MSHYNAKDVTRDTRLECLGLVRIPHRLSHGSGPGNGRDTRYSHSGQPSDTGALIQHCYLRVTASLPHASYRRPVVKLVTDAYADQHHCYPGKSKTDTKEAKPEALAIAFIRTGKH